MCLAFSVRVQVKQIFEKCASYAQSRNKMYDEKKRVWALNYILHEMYTQSDIESHPKLEYKAK